MKKRKLEQNNKYMWSKRGNKFLLIYYPCKERRFVVVGFFLLANSCKTLKIYKNLQNETLVKGFDNA